MYKDILAEIITIGDELLYGQILDTNSQWLAEQLTQIGIRLIRRTSVGDSAHDILEALAQAESKVHLVLTTGGLGPTNDDITKKTFARYFGVEMRFDEGAFEDVKAVLASRGRTEITELNRSQAFVPANCTVIHNAVGTAPGMWFERRGKVFLAMPGIPFEMKRMFSSAVEKIKAHFSPPVIYHRMLRTSGIPESQLAVLIADWESALPNHIRLAYLPRFGEVKLRLTAVGTDRAALEAQTAELFDALIPRLGSHVVDTEGDDAATALIKHLKTRQKTVSTAESCTGGYIAHLLTKPAGASAYFRGSVVAYANDTKIKLLGVKPETLQTYGAVSRECVEQMARGVRQVLETDYAIAVSGIAGPDGGTPEKPVGTIWIAAASATNCESRLLKGYADRQINIEFAQLSACNLLTKMILAE